MKRARKRRM